MKKHVLIILFLFLGITFSEAQQIKLSESEVMFEVSNMGFNTVEGTFSEMTGVINFDKTNLQSSSMNICIKSNTVNTGNNGRDEHLKNEDFFEVEKYPNICFVSTSIEKSGTDFIVHGNLTIKGVIKSVSIPFTSEKNTLKATLQIIRKDYSLGPNSGFMVGKTVKVFITAIY